MNPLQSALQYLSGVFQPKTVSSFRKPGFENVGIQQAQAQQPTPQPTNPPIAQAQAFGPQQQEQSFKYEMGKHDYSGLKPQVEKVLKGTPLEQYANNFIEAGNKHGVDPRVLITIANNESSMGKAYPQDSYNPFGYSARSAGNIKGPDGKDYINVDQGLKNAGFTSLPMAIDRLTQRFSDHPYNPTGEGYSNFRQDPTISNLQYAYNAAPEERENYLKNAQALVQQFR